MRQWEKLPGESQASYRAFGVFRDLGPGRTLRQVAAVLYGDGYQEGAKRVPGRLKTWSATHDWLARAGAYDAHLEMVARQAVEDHERLRAASFAARRDALRERIFENEERAAAITARVLDQIEAMPLVRERWAEEETEEGVQLIHVTEPAFGTSFDLAAHRLHRISQSSQPQKIAPTDPTGEHEYGRSADEIEREFDEMVGGAASDDRDEEE